MQLYCLIQSFRHMGDCHFWPNNIKYPVTGSRIRYWGPSQISNLMAFGARRLNITISVNFECIEHF